MEKRIVCGIPQAVLNMDYLKQKFVVEPFREYIVVIAANNSSPIVTVNAQITAIGNSYIIFTDTDNQEYAYTLQEITIFNTEHNNLVEYLKRKEIEGMRHSIADRLVDMGWRPTVLETEPSDQ